MDKHNKQQIRETKDGQIKIGSQVIRKNKSGGQFVPVIEQQIVNNIDELETLALAVNSNLPVLLIGDTGTGKTSLVRHLARITNNNFRRLNLNGGTTNDELKGHYVLEAQGNASKMKWLDGVLTDAMRAGYWLVLDEINACLPEITFTLHSLLDDDGFIVLDEKEGEVVKPHPNFRVFATMNPSFDYAGTKDLNKALLSRFPIVLQTKYQTPEIEKEIVKQHNDKLTEAELVSMVKVADAIRSAKNSGNINFVCSTRELINWGKLSLTMDLKRAFELAVLNKCDFQTDKQTIDDIASLHLGKITDKPLLNFTDYENELKERNEQIEKLSKEVEEINERRQQVQIRHNDEIQNYRTALLETEAKLRELHATNEQLANAVALIETTKAKAKSTNS